MMILLAVLIYTHDTPFPGRYALLPVIGTMLVLRYARAHAGVGRILSHPLLVYIGFVSYSLYLWHLDKPDFRAKLIETLAVLNRREIRTLVVGNMP